ncbi:alpha/beta fold hydrolase [Agaribacillus aureus]
MKTNIILLTLLSLMISYHIKGQNKNHMTEKTMKIKNGSTQISYLEEGKGDKTLLLLHGWCINSAYWENQIDYFKEKYKVVAIDLPGFGKSTSQRQEWTIQQYGTDVIEVIDQLGLSNVILVGHSMSGEIILEAALKDHPSVIGLVGIDNFKMIDVHFTPEQLAEMQSYMDLLQKDFKNTAPVYADKMLFHPSTDEAVRNRVKKDFEHADPEIGFSALKELMNYSMLESAGLANLNYKLYLINSDFVPTNAGGLARHCKSSFEVVDIHDTGHYPMIEKPEEFNKLLEATIEGIE